MAIAGLKQAQQGFENITLFCKQIKMKIFYVNQMKISRNLFIDKFRHIEENRD